MIPDEPVRKHLVALLKGGHAHTPATDALAGWPPESRGLKPDGVGHSAWELLEHLRIAQWDILGFSLSADHVSPDFPAGYWPPSASLPADAAWDRSVEQFRVDLEAMETLVSDPATDLLTPFAHGEGQTVLREVLTLAAHNSYHIAQLMMLGKMLGLK